MYSTDGLYTYQLKAQENTNITLKVDFYLFYHSCFPWGHERTNTAPEHSKGTRGSGGSTCQNEYQRHASMSWRGTLTPNSRTTSKKNACLKVNMLDKNPFHMPLIH